MKKTTTKNRILRSSSLLAVMVTIHSSASAWAAEPSYGKEMTMEGKMMEKCEEMKKEKQMMQVDMKAQDAELSAAVATMNSAAQDKKLDLMAGVVSRLVGQRSAMHVQKAKMQERMMKHMMAHMEMGKESIAKCPVMKEMGEKPDGSHAEHHEKSE